MGFGIKYADITDIKERTDNLPSSPANEVTSAAIQAKTDLLPASPANEVTSAAIKAKTDNLPTDPADQSDVESAISTSESNITDEVQKAVTCLDFWSDSDDVISLPAVAADIDLPDIVVSGIPTGVALVRVVAILKVRAIENTNAGGDNAIDGAQAIRVMKSTGTWGVDDLAAIDLPDNLWTVAASTRESGDVLIGDNDLKSKVDGNATYNLRFENALVDLANLQLNDVLVGLRFYFTTG